MEYSVFERLLSERGVTVYQVAKATHIAASTFTDWKNGRSTPKVDKLSRIADYFSVSLDELMGTESGKRDAEASYRNLRAQKMIPVIGVIRAGSPIVTDETLLGREFADVEDAEEYVILRVSEDGDDILMESIEDDEEFDKVEEYFNDLFFGEVDYDEE